MGFRHVANGITNTWVGGADNEPNRSILAATNALGEREGSILARPRE